MDRDERESEAKKPRLEVAVEEWEDDSGDDQGEEEQEGEQEGFLAGEDGGDLTSDSEAFDELGNMTVEVLEASGPIDFN
jgi:hypothetical protein